jgi:hypothetical protein
MRRKAPAAAATCTPTTPLPYATATSWWRLPKPTAALTDKEFAQVDAFVKRNSLEKFGPVRTVKPELVFEIAFEGIAASNRHKSGVALRFPRMSRWRHDKKPDEINTLEDLKKMLEVYGKWSHYHMNMCRFVCFIAVKEKPESMR